MHIYLPFISLKAVILLSVFSFFPFFTDAQKSGDNNSFLKTVEYINKQLGPAYLVEINEDNDRLTISFLKNGAVYKIDRVYLATLDENKIFYSPEEKALIIKCLDAKELTGRLKKFADGCFEREIVDKKMIGSYGRMNLDVDSVKAEKLKKAFVHLIKLSQDENYNGNITLE